MLKKIRQLSADVFSPKEELKPNPVLWQYIFGVLILAACGWKVYHGLQQAMDIQFADESAYLRFGLDLFGKMNRDWGPMYSIWYKCLSFISTDTIQLYYLNYAITSVLIGILLYIFLLRISIHSVFALLVSFSVLISEINISVWPRISHFCIMLFLLFLILITFIRSNIYKFLTFALLCLISSYARPEFYISFLLAMFASFVSIYYNRNQIVQRDYVVFFALLLLIGALHFIFRFPSNNFFGFNRGVAAFYQHYAYNYKVRTHANIDSWLYWEEICKKQFGDCNSMWCVIKTQPGIVFSNTLFNIRNYIISTIVHGYSYIFPVELFHGKKLQLFVYGILSLLFLYLLFKKESRSKFLQELFTLRFYLLVAFIYISPTILSCVFVFPREHYVYLQMLFVLLLLISLFNGFFDEISYKPLAILAFGLLLFLATPNIKNYSFLRVNNDTSFQCNKELVKHLRTHYADKPHTLFTNMPFVRGMLPLNFSEVNTIFDKKKNRPFSHYLDSAKIDIVILTPSTFRDPHIAFDSTWQNFLKHYQDYHFREERFNDCETYLLVKQD